MSLPDASDIADYGGALVDYQAAIEDATTDRGAANANKAYNDCAMMTRTATRAWARFTGDAATPVLIAQPNGHNAMWGSSGGVAPTLARTALGIYTITWPTSVTDQLGVAHTLNLSPAAWCQVEGTTAYFTNVIKTAANVLEAHIFLGSTAAANDASGKVITIFGT